MAQGTIEISPERCKGCGLCIEFCPKGSIHLSDHADSRGICVAVMSAGDGCTGCATCAVVCPDVAITVYRAERGGEDA